MYYKKSASWLSNAPFQCFGAAVTDEFVPLCLDWDDKPDWVSTHGTTTMRALHDCAIVQAVLPEAGVPVLYSTGHGVHAVFPNTVRQVDFQAVLRLLCFRTSSYFSSCETSASDCDGTVCGGYAAICSLDGPTLRVGRKIGRGRDITRLTPRSEVNSDLIMCHDAMIRRYNHRGIGAPKPVDTLF